MLTYAQVRDAGPAPCPEPGDERSALVGRCLSDALRIARHSLLAGVELARSAGLTVDEAGGVQPPAFHFDLDPVRVDAGRVERARLETAHHTADFLIATALRGAREAERIATGLLHRFGGDPPAAQSPTDLVEATRAGFDMLAGLVPTGGPDDVAAWWGALPDEDRQALILAVPARLAGALTGVRPRDAFRLRPVREDDARGRGVWTGWHWLDEDDHIRVPAWAQARASRDFWSHQGSAGHV